MCINLAQKNIDILPEEDERSFMNNSTGEATDSNNLINPHFLLLPVHNDVSNNNKNITSTYFFLHKQHFLT